MKLPFVIECSLVLQSEAMFESARARLLCSFSCEVRGRLRIESESPADSDLRCTSVPRLCRVGWHVPPMCPRVRAKHQQHRPRQRELDCSTPSIQFQTVQKKVQMS